MLGLSFEAAPRCARSYLFEIRRAPLVQSAPRVALCHCSQSIRTFVHYKCFCARQNAFAFTPHSLSTRPLERRSPHSETCRPSFNVRCHARRRGIPSRSAPNAPRRRTMNTPRRSAQALRFARRRHLALPTTVTDNTRACVHDAS